MCLHAFVKCLIEVRTPSKFTRSRRWSGHTSNQQDALCTWPLFSLSCQPTLGPGETRLNPGRVALLLREKGEMNWHTLMVVSTLIPPLTFFQLSHTKDGLVWDGDQPDVIVINDDYVLQVCALHVIPIDCCRYYRYTIQLLYSNLI